MDRVINYRVIDPGNVGDLLSSPLNYFEFPGYPVDRADIREVEGTLDSHAIVGGGGLIYSRFLNSIEKLAQRAPHRRLIAWGIGQQTYEKPSLETATAFDYSQYLKNFDLVGIRDWNMGYEWVPCASCLHPSFDKVREIEHEFVVFSHKKFQLNIDRFPRLTNETNDFEKVLDFLGSGETIITSSYHGAYWGLLLGRKVIAFPFSSKFYTFKHQPGIYKVEKWKQEKLTLSLFNRKIYEFRYKNKFSCPTRDWQDLLKDCRVYPEALQECRDRNQWYRDRVLEVLNSSAERP